MRTKIKLAGIFIFLMVFAVPVNAADNLSLICKSEYFSVYGADKVDVSSLFNRLDFDYFSRLDSFSGSLNDSPKEMLSETFDAFYSEVSDILDIHVYSFHGKIEILSSQSAVSDMFSRFFKTSFSERSFYLHERNTIYISEPDLTLGMLGHEIAHAIICHYFTPPPPAKMQEILTGYVEYNLRKSTGTLR